jgi:hypothetical protein
MQCAETGPNETGADDCAGSVGCIEQKQAAQHGRGADSG